DDEEQHNTRLLQVLSRLQDYGIRLNAQKCTFRSRNVNFLGHKHSDGTIEPLHSTTSAIANFATPENSTSLRSFLGLAGYYLKYVPHYATIAEPLRCLLRKNVVFNWSEPQERSFQRIKSMILESQALSIFRPGLETIVTTDASNCGIGA